MWRLRASSLFRWLFYTLLFSVALTGFTYKHSAPPHLVGAANSNMFQLVVKATPHSKYQNELQFTDNKLQRELDEGMTGAPYLDPLLPDVNLTYNKKGVPQSFGITVNGEVVDLTSKRMITISNRSQETLRTHVISIRAKHFGELLPWEEASKVLPKYSKFTITDIESGISFEGQRRAGSNHADVQPLTKADSAQLKTIYGGKWSWERKAVLVKLNGRTLAGSMHGMPHGGDGIPGNDFNGHFCIHFLGSVTHGSRLVDPAHQVMVHRAAGLLMPYISKLSPWALIDVWISAVNQGDLQLLQVTTGWNRRCTCEACAACPSSRSRTLRSSCRRMPQST
ncbi:hypothetical protein [Paenibacillus sp. N3.4]|uniref:hypothetical protein n=1 Tax=Paenibacillus sp. N3.4 TaxID=2603222 RepID=UPI0011CB99D4|nr:hypothetical protein [Paenibacillus sp. N3.4]TXK85815.1 hypothetical protein FU659_02640 [Paenibacillus sp. N3.4]